MPKENNGKCTLSAVTVGASLGGFLGLLGGRRVSWAVHDTISDKSAGFISSQLISMAIMTGTTLLGACCGATVAVLGKCCCLFIKKNTRNNDSDVAVELGPRHETYVLRSCQYTVMHGLRHTYV